MRDGERGAGEEKERNRGVKGKRLKEGAMKREGEEFIRLVLV